MTWKRLGGLLALFLMAVWLIAFVAFVAMGLLTGEAIKTGALVALAAACVVVLASIGGRE